MHADYLGIKCHDVYNLLSNVSEKYVICILYVHMYVCMYF